MLFISGQLLAQNKKRKQDHQVPDSTITNGNTKMNVTPETSPILSLSYQEYTAYQDGEEMGMARPAVLNNYPRPAQVLSLQKELKLTTDQKNQLAAADEAILFKAKEMGRFILQHEKMLNELFSTGKANEGSVIYYCNQIGLYQGELRNAHLQACLKAKRILTPDQLKKYSQLKADLKKG
jgi:Spy/CpxP family protein refolding chaperone